MMNKKWWLIVIIVVLAVVGYYWEFYVKSVPLLSNTGGPTIGGEGPGFKYKNTPLCLMIVDDAAECFAECDSDQDCRDNCREIYNNFLNRRCLTN